MGKPKHKDKGGKPTFTQVEQAVIESKNLSAHDKIFYTALKSFRNRKSKQCFPSVRRVCERAGISKDTAYPARENLETLGIIEFTQKRGRNKSCHYRFILEDGNSQEISTALSNLSENKIGGNKDSKIGGNKDSKIGGNKDTNQKKYNQMNGTHTQPPESQKHSPAEPENRVCVFPFKDEKKEIPAEILEDIERNIEAGMQAGKIRNPGGYRAALIRAVRRGGYRRNEEPENPYEQLTVRSDMKLQELAEYQKTACSYADYLKRTGAKIELASA